LTYWDLIPEELRAWSAHDGGSIGHAGEVETSLGLYLQPDLVAAELPAPAQCADLAAMGRAPFAGAAYAPPDPAREAPDGVYGYAPGGRAELGERVIELAAERLAGFVRHFAQTNPPVADNTR
jgi:creatinine amidohydrolase/Fe(II)-dependent formamide hydrolase-like protein